MGEATKRVRRRGEAGNALVLFALLLPVLMGFAGLAVDVGYLYYVRTAMQATADAACFAGGSGLLESQDQATLRARATGLQNFAQTQVLANSRLAVAFPTTTTIRTTVSDPAVPLFFGPVLGWETAPVNATSSCGISAVNSVAGGLIPLAVFCPVTPCDPLVLNMRYRDVRVGCGMAGSAPCAGPWFSRGERSLQAVYFDRSWSESEMGYYIRGYDMRGDNLNYTGTVETGDLLPHMSASYGNTVGILLRAIAARHGQTIVIPEVEFAARQGNILTRLRVTGFYAVEVEQVFFRRSEIMVTFRIRQKMVSTSNYSPAPVSTSSALAVQLLN